MTPWSAMLRGMSLRELEGLATALNHSSDPLAPRALAMVDAELASLAKRSPMLGNAEKEPAMDNNANNQNTTVWAGVKDSNIGFARQQNTLDGQGYANLTSFNAENVSGISFLDDDNVTSASSSAPQQQG